MTLQTGQVSSFSEYLTARKKSKGYLFLPYVAVGDPDITTTEKIIDLFIKCGADSIELGLPFTDPAADGAVLQRAFKRVLGQNFSMLTFMSLLERLHVRYPEFPFTVMGYSNLFYQAGFSAFLRKLYALGVRAVILPDVPFEEKQYILQDENLAGLKNAIPDWINFVTPTITSGRLEKICKESSGFIYLVSYKGVTGQANFTLKPLKKIIAAIRRQTKTPILTGFGIRSIDHTREAARETDGFIVGTRFHEIIEENFSRKEQIIGFIEKEIKSLLPQG